MERTNFLSVFQKEIETGIDLTQLDFRILMAARLIKLCRYYKHFCVREKSYARKFYPLQIWNSYEKKETLKNWNTYVDILADYVL